MFQFEGFLSVYLNRYPDQAIRVVMRRGEAPLGCGEGLLIQEELKSVIGRALRSWKVYVVLTVSIASRVHVGDCIDVEVYRNGKLTQWGNAMVSEIVTQLDLHSRDAAIERRAVLVGDGALHEAGPVDCTQLQMALDAAERRNVELEHGVSYLIHDLQLGMVWPALGKVPLRELPELAEAVQAYFASRSAQQELGGENSLIAAMVEIASLNNSTVRPQASDKESKES